MENPRRKTKIPIKMVHKRTVITIIKLDVTPEISTRFNAVASEKSSEKFN